MHEDEDHMSRIDLKYFFPPFLLYQLSFPTFLPVHLMADMCSRTLLLYVFLIFFGFLSEASPGLE